MKNKEIYVLDLPPIAQKAALSCAKNTHPVEHQDYIKHKTGWTCPPKLWINWLKNNYNNTDYDEVIAEIEQEMFPFIFGEESS